MHLFSFEFGSERGIAYIHTVRARDLERAVVLMRRLLRRYIDRGAIVGDGRLFYELRWSQACS